MHYSAQMEALVVYHSISGSFSKLHNQVVILLDHYQVVVVNHTNKVAASIGGMGSIVSSVVGTEEVKVLRGSVSLVSQSIVPSKINKVVQNFPIEPVVENVRVPSMQVMVMQVVSATSVLHCEP